MLAHELLLHAYLALLVRALSKFIFSLHILVVTRMLQITLQ